MNVQLSAEFRAFDDSANPASPERRLMLATIINAVADALGNSSIGNPGARAKAKREALAWFRATDADFEVVCYLAGVDPAVTRRKVLAYVYSGARLPANPRRNGNRHRPRSSRATASVAKPTGVKQSA